MQTDERGEFKFAGLFPDLYSVRVSLATFRACLQAATSWCSRACAVVLNVNLSTLFSTIQLSYPAASRTAA